MFNVFHVIELENSAQKAESANILEMRKTSKCNCKEETQSIPSVTNTITTGTSNVSPRKHLTSSQAYTGTITLKHYTVCFTLP